MNASTNTISERQLDWRERWRRRLCYELWNVGVVEQTAADIVANGIVGQVHWLNRHPTGMVLADPACLAHPDGARTLFAEAMSPRAGRGEIWSAELRPGEHPSTASFAPLLTAPFHMSYPFPFRDEMGAIRLTMESWQADHTALLHQQDGEWQGGSPILQGRAVLDPTLWRGDDRWWLFCTFRDDGPDSKLHLFHAATPNGPWAAHPMNPIKQDFAGSRPGGPLFMAGDMLIRPGQDSSSTYGGAVVLNVVEQLDEHCYRERPVRRLEPVPGPFQWGLHTFCPSGDVTLIDGKAWRCDPLEFASRAGRKLERMVARPAAPSSGGKRAAHVINPTAFSGTETSLKIEGQPTVETANAGNV